MNAVHAQGGPWDLALSFGQQTPPKDPEWSVTVLMSWEHAKALLNVLQQFVDNFEREMGEIPQPEIPEATKQGRRRMTATTIQEHAVYEASTQAPNLMDAFIVASEWVPMTEAHRAELVEELIAWSADPNAADWEYVIKND